MSTIEGLIWFFRRHAWHLLPKLGCVVSLPFIVVWIMHGIPSLLSAAVVKPKVEPPALLQKQNSSDVVSKTRSIEESQALPAISPVTTPEKSVSETGILGFGGRVESENEIVMIYQDGILLRNGKKHKIGETFIVEGKEETLECVNVGCGIVRFVSGKTVTF